MADKIYPKKLEEQGSLRYFSSKEKSMSSSKDLAKLLRKFKEWARTRIGLELLWIRVKRPTFRRFIESHVWIWAVEFWMRSYESEFKGLLC